LGPGRRTNRQNLGTGQRTSLLYAFYFSSQRKHRDSISSKINRVQLVHSPVTQFCANLHKASQMPAGDAAFRRFLWKNALQPRLRMHNSQCGNPVAIQHWRGVWSAQKNRDAANCVSIRQKSTTDITFPRSEKPIPSPTAVSRRVRGSGARDPDRSTASVRDPTSRPAPDDPSPSSVPPRPLLEPR